MALNNNTSLLIVDDEPGILELLTAVFKTETKNITTANDGKQALALFKQGHFDVIISDVSMPEMDGLELFISIQEVRNNTPFIFVSGEDDDKIIIKALKLGARDFISKPIKINQIKNVFDKCMREIILKKQNQQLIKSLERQATETSRLAVLGEMTASLAHDLNNPLSVLTGYTEIIHDKYISDKWLAAKTTKMIIAADRMTKLVTQITNFARNETCPENCDIRDIVENSLILIENKIKKVIGGVTVDLAPDIPKLYVEKFKFEQILMNLVGNALDALKEIDDFDKRNITIKANMLSSDRLEVKIIDNGPGMSEEIRNEIFNSFYTTKPEGQGTGLGLTIVQTLINHLNGEICVESEVNEGTTFIIQLNTVQPESKNE